MFLVLLFEFRSFTAPVAILSSAILSTSGVFLALLATRTTFNVSSFMGLIMVIGIVAETASCCWTPTRKFRAAGFSAEDAIIQLPPPAAADRDDRAGGGGRHAAIGARTGRGSQMLSRWRSVIGGC